MRHIHVELARKEPTVQLPAQEGDLPPTSTPAKGPNLGAHSGVPRPFGDEEIRMQKVYQLSIFSQRGGFSEQPEGQRPPRVGMKRALEEPVAPLAHKRLHEAEAEQEEEDDDDDDVTQGEVLCSSTSEPFYSCSLLECNKDPESPAAKTPPPLPPLSPTHAPTPSRRPAQHNHDRPVPDAWAPLSPKSPPMVDPLAPHNFWSGDASAGSPVLSPEPPPAGDAPACSIGAPPHGDGSSNGTLAEQGSSCTVTVRSPSPTFPSSSPKRLSEALEWGASLESSPPEHRAPPTNGVPSSEKTPVDPRALLNGTSSSNSSAPCPAKKKLLSSSDTGDSCSEDEGPSTSKRSRLALLAPGLGLASCRGTDAKASPFWNHLLPSARENHKVSV